MSDPVITLALPQVPHLPEQQELFFWLVTLKAVLEELEAFMQTELPSGLPRQVLASNGIEPIFLNGDNYGCCDEVSVDVIAED